MITPTQAAHLAAVLQAADHRGWPMPVLASIEPDRIVVKLASPEAVDTWADGAPVGEWVDHFHGAQCGAVVEVLECRVSVWAPMLAEAAAL